MPAFDILCLANSRKRSGRCVAGLRLDGGCWIRPVTAHPDGILEAWHYTLYDRTHARVLDALQITVEEPRPQPNQPENWLVATKKWPLLARPARDADALPVLRAALAPGPAIFGTTSARITLAELAAAPVPASLALVRPADLHWYVSINQKSGKRQVRAIFGLDGAEYNLSLTDPAWEPRFDRLAFGTHPFAAPGPAPDDEVLLTVSLGEPFEGACYKLAAAIVLLPPAWRGQV